MSQTQPATKQDIQDVISLIQDFMQLVDDRFDRLEKRLDHLEATVALHSSVLARWQSKFD